MGLFGNSNEKILREALKQANPKRKNVTCSYCGTRMTVTFLSSGDTATCRNCGAKIYQ